MVFGNRLNGFCGVFEALDTPINGTGGWVPRGGPPVRFIGGFAVYGKSAIAKEGIGEDGIHVNRDMDGGKGGAVGEGVFADIDHGIGKGEGGEARPIESVMGHAHHRHARYRGFERDRGRVVPYCGGEITLVYFVSRFDVCDVPNSIKRRRKAIGDNGFMFAVPFLSK